MVCNKRGRAHADRRYHGLRLDSPMFGGATRLRHSIPLKRPTLQLGGVARFGVGRNLRGAPSNYRLDVK